MGKASRGMQKDPYPKNTKLLGPAQPESHYFWAFQLL